MTGWLKWRVSKLLASYTCFYPPVPPIFFFNYTSPITLEYQSRDLCVKNLRKARVFWTLRGGSRICLRLRRNVFKRFTSKINSQHMQFMSPEIRETENLYCIYMICLGFLERADTDKGARRARTSAPGVAVLAHHSVCATRWCKYIEYEENLKGHIVWEDSIWVRTVFVVCVCITKRWYT